VPNVTKVAHDLHDRYPSGTSVSVYKRCMRDGAPAPAGAAIATAAVAADGTLTLAGVPDDSAGLVLVGTVGGKQVVVSTGVGKLSWAASH
jgi:hypothetical protein